MPRRSPAPTPADDLTLNQDQLAFASAIGKAFAETAHQVTAVVGPKKRR